MTDQPQTASAGAKPARKTRAGRQDRALIWGAFRPLRRRLIVVSGLAVITAVMEAAIMLSVAVLAGSLVDGKDTNEVSVLGRTITFTGGELCLVLFAMVLVRAVIDFALAEIKATMEAKYDADTRRRVAAAFLRADWAQQSTELAGGLQASLVTFVSQARTLLTKMTDSALSLVSLVIMLAASLRVAGVATFVVIAVMVVIALVLRPLTTANRRASVAQRDSSRRFSNQVIEMVALSRDIKLLGIRDQVEDQVSSEIGSLETAVRNASAATYRLQSLHSSITFLGLAGGLAVLVTVGGRDAQQYAAMVLLLYRAMTYGRALQVTYQGALGALPYLEELEERIARYEAAEDIRGDVELTAPVQSVQFDDVSFSYVAGSPALSDVSYAFGAGDAIGIVGPSGAGKSTVIQLLLGLRAPDTGRLLINGIPASEIQAASWARHVSFVAQESALFTGSVIDNVIAFRDHVSRDRAVEALRSAHVLDDILRLPEGFETQVGEGGKRLSGGQRQRVCIARALAGDPDLLVLDEPTSALDLATEEGVRETLEGIKGKITLVIVAHRMSTLRVCDQVLVVDKGRVEAFGAREELEAHNPYYAEAIRLAKLV